MFWHDNPFQQFASWFEHAVQGCGEIDPTAACLATVASNGRPSSRIVLVKQHDEHGFVFYSNLTSRKGVELSQNPWSSLCYYWPQINKQIRVEGEVQLITEDEADTYFATRPRNSQIGAWASLQSKPMEDLTELTKRYDTFANEFAGKAVPRPPHWSGYRLHPDRMEFWMQGEFRLHQRMLYEKCGHNWQKNYLYP